MLGPLTLERAYYACADCGTGFCPRDQTLGLVGQSVTPAVLRMEAAVAASVSFEEGAQLLEELADVKISPRQVERDAEALGEEIAADERADDEGINAQAVEGTAYVGLDGTGIPVRKEETEGRPGKQPDGSAKTREVKLVTLWTANMTDDEGKPHRDEGSVTYSAAIESVATSDTAKVMAPFAQRVEREAARRRFAGARRRVVLGDGALWIWKLADELFYGAIQIVDRFHAKQHLSDLGKAIFGATSQQAAIWAGLRCDELDDGRFDDLLAAIAMHSAGNDEARKGLEYFKTNRARMNYPEFERQGLMTGSGVVEAGCKTAVGVRCKRAGMHWSVPGANAIIALRCSRLSNRFDDFWERRAQAAA